MDKLSRKYVMLGIDALLTVLAACGAVLLRFEGFPPQMRAGVVFLLVPLVLARLVSFASSNVSSGLGICQHRGTLATMKAVTVGTIISGFFSFAVIQQPIPAAL